MWEKFIEWWEEAQNKNIEEIWDREEVWNAIHELSDIRAGYNCFDDKESDKYHACSLAIKALKKFQMTFANGSSASENVHLAERKDIYTSTPSTISALWMGMTVCIITTVGCVC